MIEQFPCNQCGLCCQNIGQIEELRAFDRGDGTCKYLIDKTCSIYANRPDICRVDLMFERYFAEFYDRETYYQKNLEICKQLQEHSTDK
jgi:Fe-S-cluster containining protein